MKLMKTLLSLITVVVLAGTAWAEESRTVYTADGIVKFVPSDITAGELSALLFSKPRPLTRSLFETPTTPVASVAMLIQFEFDSAELTGESKTRLDTIGEMLNSEEALNKGLTIEGHTDIIGSNEYNLMLSNKRAESVRNYLINKHDIGVERLNSVGKGESSLIDPTDPKGPINRRVQFSARA